MIKISEKLAQHLIIYGINKGCNIGNYKDELVNFYKREYEDEIYNIMEIESKNEYYVLEPKDTLFINTNDEFHEALSGIHRELEHLVDLLKKEGI